MLDSGIHRGLRLTRRAVQMCFDPGLSRVYSKCIFRGREGKSNSLFLGLIKKF